jgi:hypothetical protein
MAIAALCGPASSTPPYASGFMVGSDSSLFVYWFHAEIHLYEQGIDGQLPELNISPGVTSGQYSVAQKTQFPYLSFIIDNSIKIYDGYYLQNGPGNRFSLFGYSIYTNGADSLPVQPGLLSRVNRLDELSEDSPWAVNIVDLSNLAGENLWSGFNWFDSTPNAPQIMSIIPEGAEQSNKIGEKVGDIYYWNNLSYAPLFRNRFMTLFETTDSVETGWRRLLENADQPDSFLITCYGPTFVSGQISSFAGCDTLIHNLPDRVVDSVSIRSCYGTILDETELMIHFDAAMIPPILAGVDNNGNRYSPYQFEMIIENRGADSICIALGYDKKWICHNDGRVVIPGKTYMTSAFELSAPEVDSSKFLFLIQDHSQEYYPYLLTVPYPPPEATDVVSLESEENVPMDNFLIYPNPSNANVTVYLKRRANAAHIEIYNIVGQRVWEKSCPLQDRLIWDGRDGQGRQQPSGIYLFRLIGQGKEIATQKVVLLR